MFRTSIAIILLVLASQIGYSNDFKTFVKLRELIDSQIESSAQLLTQQSIGEAEINRRRTVALHFSDYIAWTVIEIDNSNDAKITKLVSLFKKGEFEKIKIEQGEKNAELYGVANFFSICAFAEIILLNPSKAAEVYSNAEALFPEHGRIVFEFGFLQHSQKEYEQAIDKYMQCKKMQGNTSFIGVLEHNLGNLYSSVSQWDLANDHYNAALIAKEKLNLVSEEHYYYESGKSYLSLVVLNKNKLEIFSRKKYHALASEYVKKAEGMFKKLPKSNLKSQYLDKIHFMKRFLADYPMDVVNKAEEVFEIQTYADSLIMAGKTDDAILLYKDAIKKQEYLIKLDNSYPKMLDLCMLYECWNNVEPQLNLKIQNQQKVISIEESIFKQNSSVYTIAAGLAASYGKLAWYYIIDGKYKLGNYYALKGYVTDSSQDWLNAIVAVSYVFNGQLNRAKEIYMKYKDQPYAEGTYKDLFLQSLDDIEAEGVTHADISMARKMLTSE